MGEHQENPTEIYCDNKSAIAMAKNTVHHSKTKHIAIKYHFLREATTKKEIEQKYIGTRDQLAYIFTKPLLRLRFEILREKLGVIRMSTKGEY